MGIAEKSEEPEQPAGGAEIARQPGGAGIAACLWEDSLAAVLVVDPATHTIVDVNQVALGLMGRSRQEVVGRVCHNFVCPAEVDRCPITELGQRIDLSERVLLGAGARRTPILKSVREVSVEGRRLLVESFVDITGLKKAERDLEESRRFIQSVVDGIGDPVLVIDPADYRVVLANRAARELCPGNDPAAAGMTCHTASHGSEHPCDQGHGVCPLKEVLATKQPVRVTHRHVTAAGEAVVDVLATPVLDAAGAVTAVIEANRDITLYQQAVDAIERAKLGLERQNEELRKLDRVKDALMGDISHELKTPVAKHAMQLEILALELRRIGVYDQVRGVIESMSAGICRQQSVIRNILMLSRLESGHRKFRCEPVRVDGLLEEVLAEYLDTIDSLGIRLELALAPATALADREMLWHVLSNVVNNAIKYRGEVGPRIGVDLRRDGGRVRITVTDNGVGMSPRSVAQAFERFYQASASSEGVGIGLNISRTILDHMDGAIAIDSPGENRGTSVTVTLPAATAV